MELTSTQQDALIELLNIGFGRAAASLSQLTGHRVVLDVPCDAVGVRLRRARLKNLGAADPDVHQPVELPAGDRAGEIEHDLRPRTLTPQAASGCR